MTMSRMNGVFPPVGTIVGAPEAGLALVVEAQDEHGVVCRSATAQDFGRLMLAQEGQPWSVYEHAALTRRTRW